MMVEFGSLFAGIGGFDLGLEYAGMTCAWQVEVDARCNEVLAYHWPDVQRYGDVKNVGRHDLEPVDLICGGFPCQGLSVAGRRAGLADERSGLWWEFHRVIEELHPRWVIIENVPGLLSSNRGRDMAAIIGALAELGYGWAYRVLDAQYFGVAQRRRRVFIIGSLGDRTGAAKVLFESESLRRDSAPRREEGQRIAAPVKAGAPSRRNGGSWPIAEEFVVTGTLNSGGNNGGFRTEPGEHMVVQHALSGHNQRNDPDGEHFIIARPLAYSQTMNHYDESQQTYVPVAFDWQQGGHSQENLTATLSVTRTQAVNSRVGIRRLTPTECERLQGFPDGWTAVNGMKDTPRYRMLGNAVCVPVAEWIGRRLQVRIP